MRLSARVLAIALATMTMAPTCDDDDEDDIQLADLAGSFCELAYEELRLQNWQPRGKELVRRTIDDLATAVTQLGWPASLLRTGPWEGSDRVSVSFDLPIRFPDPSPIDGTEQELWTGFQATFSSSTGAPSIVFTRRPGAIFCPIQPLADTTGLALQVVDGVTKELVYVNRALGLKEGGPRFQQEIHFASDGSGTFVAKHNHPYLFMLVQSVKRASPRDAGAPTTPPQEDAGSPPPPHDAGDPPPHDAGDPPPQDAGDPPKTIAHLYATSRANDRLSRFRILDGQLEAVADTELTVTKPTGVAVGPSGTLYVASEADGSITRWATSADPPTALSALPSPKTGWKPSGLAFVPTGEGAGELWVASSSGADELAVYLLDASGNATAPPALVSTGLASDLGTHGIQSLAWDEPSSSLFVAADQVHRILVIRDSGHWSLSPLTDDALTQLGASDPTGLAMTTNRWLVAVYPNAFLNLGYWSVSDYDTTFLQGASGTGGTFTPVSVAVLPTQPATEPQRLYVGTTQDQIVVIDAESQSVPSVKGVVCNVAGLSHIALGP